MSGRTELLVSAPADHLFLSGLQPARRPGVLETLWVWDVLFDFDADAFPLLIGGCEITRKRLLERTWGLVASGRASYLCIADFECALGIFAAAGLDTAALTTKALS